MTFCRTGTVRFIEDHRDEFPVTRMCKVLDVSPSGCYAWRQRPPSAREMANQELRNTIEAMYDDNHTVYVSPRIYRELEDPGVVSSENRIDGIPFVVAVSGEPIYSGAFYTPASSISYDGVAILEPLSGNPNTISIQLDYPGLEAFDGEDPRSDPRIIAAAQSFRR